MAEVSNQINKIDSIENNHKKTAAEASFKKLQPEEFYRHHIEKVKNNCEDQNCRFNEK